MPAKRWFLSSLPHPKPLPGVPKKHRRTTRKESKQVPLSVSSIKNFHTKIASTTNGTKPDHKREGKIKPNRSGETNTSTPSRSSYLVVWVLGRRRRRRLVVVQTIIRWRRCRILFHGLVHLSGNILPGTYVTLLRHSHVLHLVPAFPRHRLTLHCRQGQLDTADRSIAFRIQTDRSIGDNKGGRKVSA